MGLPENSRCFEICLRADQNRVPCCDRNNFNCPSRWKSSTRICQRVVSEESTDLKTHVDTNEHARIERGMLVCRVFHHEDEDSARTHDGSSTCPWSYHFMMETTFRYQVFIPDLSPGQNFHGEKWLNRGQDLRLLRIRNVQCRSEIQGMRTSWKCGGNHRLPESSSTTYPKR